MQANTHTYSHKNPTQLTNVCDALAACRDELMCFMLEDPAPETPDCRQTAQLDDVVTNLRDQHADASGMLVSGTTAQLCVQCQHLAACRPEAPVPLVLKQDVCGRLSCCCVCCCRCRQ